jgi:hypothetical protein
VSTVFIVAIYTITTALLRSRYDSLGLGRIQRAKRGAVFGAVVGGLFTINGILYRAENGSPPLELGEGVGLFGFMVAMGIFNLQKWPEGEGIALRETLDDPDNISPAQRETKLRESSNDEHNK